MNRSDFEEVRTSLSSRGQVIAEASYRAESFGSWFVAVATTPGLRVVWDGKERWLMVQEETKEQFAGMPVWRDLWIARSGEQQTVELACRELLSRAGAG